MVKRHNPLIFSKEPQTPSRTTSVGVDHIGFENWTTLQFGLLLKLSRDNEKACRASAMVRSVYMHIGMHKTGSTSIQEAFRDYDDGTIRYANLGHPNHSLLFCAAFGHNNAKHDDGNGELVRERRLEARQKLEAYLSCCAEADIVFSGEEISNLDQSGVSQLADFLRGHADHIVVISYLRDPLSFIRSVLQQTIKTGSNLPTKPNYRFRLDKFITEFGRENVWVRQYDALPSEDIVADFAGIVGLRAPSTVFRLNESLSTDAVRILYLLNDFVGHGSEFPGSVVIRQRFARHLRSLLPGSFDLPDDLIIGLIDKDDLQWLFTMYPEISWDIQKGDTGGFCQDSLNRFFSNHSSSASEALERYMRKEAGLTRLPRNTEALIIRYFTLFVDVLRPNCAHFEPERYLKLNPDVALANVNPYEHYLKYGLFEGRQT